MNRMLEFYQSYLIGNRFGPIARLWDLISYHLLYKYLYRRIFRHYGKNIRWGKHGFKRVIPASIRISSPHLIAIYDDVQIDEDVFLQAHANGEGISIGPSVRLNKGVHIQAYGLICLEHHVLVAPYAHISTSNHGFALSTIPIMLQDQSSSGSLTIGAGTWIGHSAHVLGQVTVSPNSVVAAAAVVTRAPAFRAVLAGVPARPVKEI